MSILMLHVDSFADSLRLAHSTSQLSFRSPLNKAKGYIIETMMVRLAREWRYPVVVSFFCPSPHHDGNVNTSEMATLVPKEDPCWGIPRKKSYFLVHVRYGSAWGAGNTGKDGKGIYQRKRYR
jgi:hypothetical protein